MTKRWIVVADSARARIFEAGRGSELNEIEDLSHPESRLHEGDLRTGATGSRQQRMPTARSASGPTTPAHDKHTEGFARDISRYLDDARHRGRFEELIVAAAPAVLGELRDHLNAATRACITREIDKNWAQQSREEIEQDIEKVLTQ
ncbi:MAG TPA: host attachment protein [Gammaproteobacteria bacterium]|jgi:protein required for attachment to host cells|nr:host attachment protein [Gammaproteobacteria bacterium]